MPTAYERHLTVTYLCNAMSRLNPDGHEAMALMN